jgi:hypothetical protein
MKKYFILLLLLSSCSVLSTNQNDSTLNHTSSYNLYNITLYDNDHTVMEVLYFKENDSVVLPKYYKNDFDFLGWTTNNDINAIDFAGYLPKYEINYMPNYNIKLYAIWVENTFSIINKFKKIVADEKQNFKSEYFISDQVKKDSFSTKTNISISFIQNQYEIKYDYIYLGNVLKNQTKFEINSSFIFTNSVLASYNEFTYINNKLTKITTVLIDSITFISPKKYDISYNVIRNDHYENIDLLLNAINQSIFESYYGIKYKLQDDYQIYYTERIFFGDVIFDSLI